jgi:hypothetical protein
MGGKNKTSDHGDGKSVIKIDPVLAKNDKSDQDKSWVGNLKEVEALGVIAVAYANTLAYKLECKRLDTELKRIREQKIIMTDMIKKSFEIQMKQLEIREMGMKKAFKKTNKELDNIHIERMKVLKLAEIFAQKTMSDGISFEERNLYKDMAIEFTKQIPIFADKANESLKKLVDALPDVKIPYGLLTDAS